MALDTVSESVVSQICFLNFRTSVLCLVLRTPMMSLTSAPLRYENYRKLVRHLILRCQSLKETISHNTNSNAP